MRPGQALCRDCGVIRDLSISPHCPICRPQSFEPQYGYAIATQHGVLWEAWGMKDDCYKPRIYSNRKAAMRARAGNFMSASVVKVRIERVEEEDNDEPAVI